MRISDWSSDVCSSDLPLFVADAKSRDFAFLFGDDVLPLHALGELAGVIARTAIKPGERQDERKRPRPGENSPPHQASAALSWSSTAISPATPATAVEMAAQVASLMPNASARPARPA